MIPRSHSLEAIHAAIAHARALGATLRAEEGLGPLGFHEFFLVNERGYALRGPDTKPIRYGMRWHAALDLRTAPAAVEG